jgi:uncharacterized protein (TIGR03435 family)
MASNLFYRSSDIRRSWTVVICGVIAVSWLSSAVLSRAQSKAAEGPHFDVGSIKLNADGDYRVYSADNAGGRFSVTGITFRLLMRYGYDVQDFQIIGGPRWIGTDRWNVEAKADGVAGRLPVEQQKHAIQALLADRFHLKVHFEKKKLVPAYALVVERGGAKFKDSTAGTGFEVRLGRGHISLKKARLTALATQLTRQLGRQVVDKTNLTGEYDLALDWTPAAGESSAIPGQPGPPPEIQSDGDDLKPSIFTALQAQLGLRLQATKAPLDVLIIDRVERPSEN